MAEERVEFYLRLIDQQLQSSKNYSTFIKKATANLAKLRARKLGILQAMLQEAKAYSNVADMRLERDEQRLLYKLNRILRLEMRYVRHLEAALADVIALLQHFGMIFNDIHKNDYYYQSKGINTNNIVLESLIDELGRVVYPIKMWLSVKIDNLSIKIEETKKWSGRDLFHTIFFWKRTDVLRDFQTHINGMSESIRVEQLKLHKVLNEVESNFKMFQQKAWNKEKIPIKDIQDVTKIEEMRFVRSSGAS